MARTRKCKRRACRKKFAPEQSNQIYCSPECRNREGQRRLRERAKLALTFAVEQNGVMGESNG